VTRSDLDEELTPAPRNAGVDAAVAAARRVMNALLHAGNNSAAEMTDVAEQLNTVADYLEGHAPSVEERMLDMWAGEGVTRHNPVTGPENAIAPPVFLEPTPDGGVRGEATLGLVYQGPPGYVHGGISALLLDHTLGVANHVAGESGMTAQLTIRYRRPTPLFEPLTITARQEQVAGRKIRTGGSIWARGEECVTADGLFISPAPAPSPAPSPLT
jgi:acyl-coenzyme A thioesterase PaaI-like protein